MRLASLLRKLRVGLAFVAACASALAPAAPHLALRGDAASGAWVEVCSVSGTQRVLQQDDLGTPKAPAKNGAHGQACLYCASLAMALGLPSVATPALPPPTARPVLALAASDPTAGARAWSSPHSRAPPGARG